MLNYINICISIYKLNFETTINCNNYSETPLYIYILKFKFRNLFANAKRGFSTFLEGSRCSALQCCSSRFSQLSKSNPEFLEFLEFVDCLADTGTPSWLFWQSGQAGSIAP